MDEFRNRNMRPGDAGREIWVWALCLIVLGLSSRASLVARDTYHLTRPPMVDDSYYDQTYARAIARGDFFTLNGVDIGNAYHPLYNISISPVYRFVTDTLLSLRLVVALHVVMALVAGVLMLFAVKAIFERARLPHPLFFGLLGFGLYEANALTYAGDMNLMQTGLQMLLMSALVCMFACQATPTSRGWLALGLLFALFCLSRIDGSVILLGVGGVLFLQGRLKVTNGLRLCLPAMLAVLTWLYIGHSHTGFWMPTGGTANWAPFAIQRLIGNTADAAQTLVYMFVAIPREPPFWPLWWVINPMPRHAVVLALVVAAGVVWLRAMRSPAVKETLSPLVRSYAPLAAGMSLLVLAYLPNFNATYFFQRYFSVWLPLLVIGWTSVLGLLWSSRRVWAVRSVLTVALVLFVVSLQRVAKAPSDMWFMWTTVRDIDDDQWIASGETGVLGFYRRRTLNLDGKTNAAALRARRDGADMAYLVERQPEWIVDRLGYTLGAFSDTPDFQRLYERTGENLPVLWRRRDVTR